jgi:uncharacterized membrane protein
MGNKAHVVLLAIIALVCVGALSGIVLLLPSSVPEDAAAVTDQGVTLLDGRITAIEEAPAAPADAQVLGPGARALTVTARLDAGRDVTFEMIDETGDTFSVGQRVRVAETESPDGGEPLHYIADIKRERPLLILAAIFLVAVLGFGRWQGLRALIGLAVTLAVVVLFVVPAVLAGRDPVLIALSASVAIMVVTLYLTHGVNPKSTAAVLGTLGALGVTAGLSWLFIEFASLSGLASEEARMASFQVGGLSLRGLLLAGIIIGALGVLDDVTMAQSSAVFEFRAADPAAGSPELYSRAMSVGRDHVAATINTLFLAYAGASLPLLILFSSSPDSLSVIVSSEVVAIEIVRTLVGSVGLMASVPLTTFLAARLATVSEPAVEDDVAVAGEHAGADLRASASEPVGGDRRVRVSASEPDIAGVRPPEPAQHEVPLGPGVPRRGRESEDVFADAKPFSADDEAESDWERRLRDSYGLDRLHAARRRPPE